MLLCNTEGFVIGMTGASSCVSLPIPSIEVQPQARSSLQHTLDRLHSNGEGLDWAVQNRFKQNISGMVCHKKEDIISSWICTAAGDVFAQRMDLNDVRENRMVDKSSTNWVSQWTSCVKDIERDPVSIVATELYSSFNVVEGNFTRIFRNYNCWSLMYQLCIFIFVFAFSNIHLFIIYLFINAHCHY